MKTGFRDKLPRLRRHEAVGSGLRAVVRECGEVARAGSATELDAAAVHQARRALKRARAALRLAETFGVKGARATRHRLAALARRLSPLRDDAIVAELSRELLEKAPAKTQDALTDLRHGREALAGFSLSGWRRALAVELSHADRLAWNSPSPLDVEQALARSARRIGRRARDAKKSGDMAEAHEWRKAVIVLREQVLIARPLLGREAAALHERLHDFAHALGRATDLRVLIERADDHAWPKAWRAIRDRLRRFLRKKLQRAFKHARKRWPPLKRELRAAFS